MTSQDKQKFKGAAFNAMKDTIRERFGDEGLARVLKGSSKELRQYSSKRVFDNEWVPDRVGGELMERADEVLGKGDGSLMRELGHGIAQRNLKGIYKAFVKLSSIRGLLKRADIIWQKYYSHGAIKVLENEPNRFVFEVVDYDPFPSTCTGILGWLDMFLEVYKKRGTARHMECKLRGDRGCLFEVKWE